jgi:hypothetical protein
MSLWWIVLLAALIAAIGGGWLIMRAVAAPDHTDREHDA